MLLWLGLSTVQARYLDRQYTVAAYLCSMTSDNRTELPERYPASEPACSGRRFESCVEEVVCYLREQYTPASGEGDAVVFVVGVIVILLLATRVAAARTRSVNSSENPALTGICLPIEHAPMGTGACRGAARPVWQSFGNE